MEHRMNVRVSLRLPVSLSYGCKGDGPRGVDAVIRNLSFDGALVEPGTAGLECLEPGMLVRLSLPSNPHGPFPLEALVLRRDADGLGLLFAHYGDGIFERVAALLAPEFSKHFGPDRLS